VEFDLGEQAVIRHVADSFKELSELSASNEEISINCQNVKQIDTAFLQMLSVIKELVLKNGHSVQIIDPSEEFITSCQLLGLNEFLLN